MGMTVEEEERPPYEIALVIPKRDCKERTHNSDCVDLLVNALEELGFILDIVPGLADEFVKLAAPLKTLGKAANDLQMRKPTYIGMELQFEWEDVAVFVRQPDGSLFSWLERFQCYHHLLYGIVNTSSSFATLTFEDKEFRWEPGDSLLHVLESEGIVKQVFPLHVEIKKKKLLTSWVFNWKNLSNQPIDDMYSYFGLKIAIYFSFLQMYSRWILFPAVLGLIVQLVDFGSLHLLALSAFFVCVTLWAVFFFQFWKRKNAALLTRWPMTFSLSAGVGYKSIGTKWSSLHSPLDVTMCLGIDKEKEREAYQRDEWFGHLMRFRNNAIIILSIICLQLPFELAYAHLYEVIQYDFMKYGLTAVYLVIIQYFTKIGGKICVKLVENEANEDVEYQANSLVYKVFGVYFMQSYIGVFYHALLRRNFMSLRQVLIQRLIVYQVLENLFENFLPFLKYSYKKYKAVRLKKKRNRDLLTKKIQFASKAEKESLKPTYSASVCEELEDGLFDDFLQLALQFGMIMMFACAFPLAFGLAAVNCFTEIKTDALKLLATMKRPVPRAAATIGAWANIFQFLIVMSICTNSALLVWIYDQEAEWKIEPALAAILVMEHILLLIKFGISRVVPEEPAWVRANRLKNATQVQDVCTRQLLKSLADSKNSPIPKKHD